MRLFIAIGRHTRTSAAELVYLGDDGVALETAVVSSSYPIVEKFLNPRGIRKNNSRHAENAAAEERAIAAETEAAQAAYNAAVALKAEELCAARLAETDRLIAERDAKIKELTDKLLSAEQQSMAFQTRADTAEAAQAKTAADLAKAEAELASLRSTLKAAKKAASAD